MALSDGRKQLAQVEVDFLHWFIGPLVPRKWYEQEAKTFCKGRGLVPNEGPENASTLYRLFWCRPFPRS